MTTPEADLRVPIKAEVLVRVLFKEIDRLRAIEDAALLVMSEWDELGPTGTQSTLGAHAALRAALDEESQP